VYYIYVLRIHFFKISDFKFQVFGCMIVWWSLFIFTLIFIQIFNWVNSLLILIQSYNLTIPVFQLFYFLIFNLCFFICLHILVIYRRNWILFRIYLFIVFLYKHCLLSLKFLLRILQFHFFIFIFHIILTLIYFYFLKIILKVNSRSSLAVRHYIDLLKLVL
jgi:hypothetical protein